jgi:hypothetical protein
LKIAVKIAIAGFWLCGWSNQKELLIKATSLANL